jgi:hypothetical protein
MSLNRIRTAIDLLRKYKQSEDLFVLFEKVLRVSKGALIAGIYNSKEKTKEALSLTVFYINELERIF